MRRALLPGCLIVLLPAASVAHPPALAVVAGQSPQRIVINDFPPQEGGLRDSYRRFLQREVAGDLLARRPTDTATFEVLIGASRPGDALDVLERIVRTRPDRMGEALEIATRNSWSFTEDDSRDLAERLGRSLALVRERAAELPREEAAALVAAAVPLEIELLRRSQSSSRSDLWTDSWKQFHVDYGGTQAALLVEVDMFDRHDDRIGQLARFAAERPGTEAGAKALYRWADYYDWSERRQRGSDPAPMLLEILETAAHLTSGAFPQSEWVRAAQFLPLRAWFPEDALISDDNFKLLIPKYVEFLAVRVNAGSDLFAALSSRDEGTLGQEFVRAIRRIYETRGAPWEGLAAVFDQLETMTGRTDAVRYLRGLAFTHDALGYDSEVPPEIALRGLEVLDELVDSGREPYARRALATAATARFIERDLAAASRDFLRYQAAYPESDWAWVAGLRLGQSLELLQDRAGALASYRRTIAERSSNAYAVVLAELYSARAMEAEGNYAAALRFREGALSRWTPALADSVDFVGRQRSGGEPETALVERDYVVRVRAVRRLAQLRWMLGFEAGSTVERARALVQADRFDEAIGVLEPLDGDGADTGLAAEVGTLVAFAELGRILAAVEVTHPSVDPYAASGDLGLIAEERWSPATGGAGLAQAALLSLRGETGAADAVMKRTLDSWVAGRQARRPPYEPHAEIEALEEDVTAIRNSVFLPLGGGIYGDESWNGFEFPSALPPYLVVNPRIEVTVPGSFLLELWLDAPVPGFANVVFMPTEDISILYDILGKLGGTATREPLSPMELPNQPVGGAPAIAAFWNRFFPTRPGHWFGWEFETYPHVRRVEFHDAERNRASAYVTVGYAGGTIVLEKIDGKWIAVRMTNQWVT